METTKNYFFRDTGSILERSMRGILRSRDTMIALAIILMPIALVVLLVYAFSGVLRTLEKIFLSIICKKEN